MMCHNCWGHAVRNNLWSRAAAAHREGIHGMMPAADEVLPVMVSGGLTRSPYKRQIVQFTLVNQSKSEEACNV